MLRKKLLMIQQRECDRRMLKIKLKDLSFKDTFSCYFYNLQDYMRSNIKVDTGCGITSLALKGLYSEDKINKMIEKDYKNFKEKGYPEMVYSIGVNTRNVSRPKLSELTLKEVLTRTDIGFIHKMYDFKLGDFSLGDVEVKVMYNRPGHSLLGMNILKEFDSKIQVDEDGDVVYLLNKRKSEDSNQCKQSIRDLLIRKISIKEVEVSLFDDYDETTIHRCMCELLAEHHVIDGKL